MRFTFRWKTSGGAVLAAATLTVGLAGYAAPAGAAPAARNARLAAASSATGNSSPAARFASLASGGVSPEAAVGTPQLQKNGTGEEVIRQLAQCGTTMYAVGRFTQINQAGKLYTRNNIFSFSATGPSYAITSWAPVVNGQVNAIAFNPSNCADAYIGGSFTNINGTTVSNIAEIDTTTGNVISAFGHSANNEVWTMVYAKGHLLTGGDFHLINGSKNPFMASLSPSTGQDDGFLQLNISGGYNYCVQPTGTPCTKNSNSSQVYNQQLSHNNADMDLVEGRFTSVGGVPRQQIFMLDLTGAKATVTGWTSPEWDASDLTNYPYARCWPSLAFYIRSAAWSPNDSTVYLATTGYHPAVSTNTNPRKGLCDSVTAWPATSGKVFHTWIEYSGCDSYYSVGADNGAVYAAGHPRWADNPNGCNQQGPGATPDTGLQGFYPTTIPPHVAGTVELNSGGSALYSMSRDNAGYMLFTSAGLWIASAERYSVNKCGDLQGPPGQNSADHAGICFLPYP